MKRFNFPQPKDIEEIICRPVFEQGGLRDSVTLIIERVRKEGDAALREFTERFDQVKLDSFWVSEDQIQESRSQIEPELVEAIENAYSNIRTFHLTQREAEKVVETAPGINCWRRSLPIPSIGIYIPGGTAPLLSTALMLGVPAQIAECCNITVCTPAGKTGVVHPAILFALSLCGITQVCKVGGAQAIAALAFGTESISAVDKILGPGNQYVTMAKQIVSQMGVAIDMPAGPSEVAVIADEKANAQFIAADLLSQAEHGVDSQVLFVSTAAKLIDQVEDQIAKQLETLPRAEFAKQALLSSRAVLVRTLEEGMEIVNRYAPEHLILMTQNAKQLSNLVINAGSVFIGDYSPVSAGDYASGTNHTLPTNGYAKAMAGLSLDSFVKKATFQEISADGISKLGKTIEVMARAEGLEAHARSVSIRVQKGE